MVSIGAAMAFPPSFMDELRARVLELEDTVSLFAGAEPLPIEDFGFFRFYELTR